MRQFVIGFAVLSFLTVALGALTLQQFGLGMGVWLRNPVAWLVGGLLCLGLAQVLRPSPWLLLLALLLLVLTFAGAGQEGVHRWLILGPVQVNVAPLILPLTLTAAQPKDGAQEPALWLIGMGLIAILLAWQPDRSQLAAFSVAVLTLTRLRFSSRSFLCSVLVILLAALLCAWRPDPLLPVPHVEGVMSMAWVQSPLLAIVMFTCLILTALSPLWLWRDKNRRAPAVALSLYSLACALPWLFGTFPVPLAGYGVSFVLGWWLGIAGLFAKSRRTTA
ncbi:hypothetical protein [Asticcacaulis sp. AND118]|uniref:hypothetical protein n=1 Tax=Asticcacaulis sp. AND118 TaxID=2840468 RepID=UPI001CFFB394|nr:hypothetical protein [Asticcacaulis sp. AND118]UDF04182.1 hypothetical protein LH365_03830 [Asticcacaulis sp. AND118]